MSQAFSSELDRLIHDRMIAGEYPSEEALLRDALVALDDVQQRREELRAEIQSRVAEVGKGRAEPLDLPSFLAEARRRWTLREQSKPVG